jgi:hypothetical protein
MALPILDGNQSATTLSSILTSGEHIPAHTVVSLGTQAITDISGAVSGSVVSISSLPAISGTVTANVAGNLNGTIENYDTDGTATHKVAVQIYDPNGQALGGGAPLPISGTVTVGSEHLLAQTSSYWEYPAFWRWNSTFITEEIVRYRSNLKTLKYWQNHIQSPHSAASPSALALPSSGTVTANTQTHL